MYFSFFPHLTLLAFDISADLLELARTPVTVVSAGVKSILDISKTVEFLETHSVNAIVYGERNEFPGFFTQKSGCKGQFNTMDLEEVARVIGEFEYLSLGSYKSAFQNCPKNSV